MVSQDAAASVANDKLVEKTSPKSALKGQVPSRNDRNFCSFLQKFLHLLEKTF